MVFSTTKKDYEVADLHKQVEDMVRKGEGAMLYIWDYKEAKSSGFCTEWLANHYLQRATIIAPSIIISIVNIIICMIFERLAYLDGAHTTNDETKSQFQKILLLQFLNIGVVILLVNINIFDGGLAGLPILGGDYDDLSSEWYSQVGKTICFTLFLNIFSPHASKLFWPMLNFCKRWSDRSWGCSLKDDETGAVNTKKVLQDDLNALYTGAQISSHYVYA